jgi:hypothetical protein
VRGRCGVPQKVRVHGDLEVYRRAFDAAMEIFAASEAFPKHER